MAAPVTVITPEQAPKSENIDSTPQGGLSGSSIGAIVGSVVGAALAAAAIVLAVLLTRRNRQRKAAKQNEEAMAPKEQDSTSSHDSESSSSSVTQYETVNVPDTQSTQLVKQDTSGYHEFSNTTTGHYSETPATQHQANVTEEAMLPPAQIEKRMKIPYKSLVFNFELGSGNFGKVFKGYVVKLLDQ